MRQFLVNVNELLRRPGNAKEVSASAPAGDLDIRDARIDAVCEIAGTFHLESQSDGLMVSGTIRVPWQDTCARCLEPVAVLADVEVHEHFQLTVTDPDATEIIGDQIDLAPIVRESALLELPLTALCRPDCKGICADCGALLNEDDCGCTTDSVDPRWAALDALRPRLSE